MSSFTNSDDFSLNSSKIEGKKGGNKGDIDNLVFKRGGGFGNKDDY